MAERPSKYPPLPTFADDKYYKIQLYRPAEVGGRKLTPAAKQIIVTGEVAKEIAESIYKAEETQAP